MDKKWLYLIMSGILLIILVVSNFRYNRLNKELNKLKIESIEKIDSLTYINRELEKQVSDYKSEVIQLEDAIDSLQKVKNKIIVKKDQVLVSNSISEGITLLQENLSRWSE